MYHTKAQSSLQRDVVLLLLVANLVVYKSLRKPVSSKLKKSTLHPDIFIPEEKSSIDSSRKGMSRKKLIIEKKRREKQGKSYFCVELEKAR